MRLLDENKLYDISNYLEPREGKEAGDKPAVLNTDPWEHADANGDEKRVR